MTNSVIKQMQSKPLSNYVDDSSYKGSDKNTVISTLDTGYPLINLTTDSDRPELESCLCHVTCMTLGKLFNHTNPQFPHL